MERRHGLVDGKPPRQRNDAVPVRERSEHYEACDTPERETAGGSAVAVDRSERARRERREELAERRRDRWTSVRRRSSLNGKGTIR